MKLLSSLWVLTVALLCFSTLASGKKQQVKPSITILTQNVFVGADLQSLRWTKGFSNKLKRIDYLFQQVSKTDFTTRARALAKEIKRINPHIICLQEVAVWRVGKGLLPRYAKDKRYVYDFLAILQKVLAQARLPYKVAIQEKNESIVAPSIRHKVISLTDYNVILVKKQIAILSTKSGHFRRQRVIGPKYFSYKLKKGWVSALVQINNKSYHIVNCHLDLLWKIKNAQIKELFSLLSKLRGKGFKKAKTLLAGDFNTNPSYNRYFKRLVKRSKMYDLASRLRQNYAKTCCRRPKSLRNKYSRLRARVDLLLATKTLKPLRVGRIGVSLSSRGLYKKKYRLWISDHAGVWGSFQ